MKGLRDCGVGGRGDVGRDTRSWRMGWNDSGGFDEGYMRNVNRRSLT
jgi:hypothetical protein